MTLALGGMVCTTIILVGAGGLVGVFALAGVRNARRRKELEEARSEERAWIRHFARFAVEITRLPMEPIRATQLEEVDTTAAEPGRGRVRMYAGVKINPAADPDLPGLSARLVGNVGLGTQIDRAQSVSSQAFSIGRDAMFLAERYARAWQGIGGIPPPHDDEIARFWSDAFAILGSEGRARLEELGEMNAMVATALCTWRHGSTFRTWDGGWDWREETREAIERIKHSEYFDLSGRDWVS